MDKAVSRLKPILRGHGSRLPSIWSGEDRVDGPVNVSEYHVIRFIPRYHTRVSAKIFMVGVTIAVVLESSAHASVGSAGVPRGSRFAEPLALVAFHIIQAIVTSCPAFGELPYDSPEARLR